MASKIRLIRKYAAALNGFDLADAAVGDVLVVTNEVAGMLTREGWAEPIPDNSRALARKSLPANPTARRMTKV